MDSILQQITDWLKEMLVSAIMGNLSGMFESVNNQVGEIATSVGMTPANFSPGVFAMVRNISESVIIPIAGLILTFIACYELIQMIIDHNNLANFETWIFFKWVFKTFVAVMLITNTFNITMAVFDVTQHVINASAGIISGNTAIDASAIGNNGRNKSLTHSGRTSPKGQRFRRRVQPPAHRRRKSLHRGRKEEELFPVFLHSPQRIYSNSHPDRHQYSCIHCNDPTNRILYVSSIPDTSDEQ